MTYTLLSAYRKDVAALIVKTRLLLGDPSGERWTSAQIIEALNFAALEFAIETECIQDEIEIQLKADSWAYDIINSITEDGTVKPYGWLKRVGYYGKSSPALSPSTNFVLDHAGLAGSTVGTTTRFHLDMLSYGEVGVLPIPSEDGAVLPSDTGNIQVSYVGMPDEMVNTTDYPDSSIQAMYHQYLPYRAASYWLERSDDEEDLAMAAQFDMNFRTGCSEAVGDQYQGQTGYADMRPM